jgi:hypothetical protein
MRNPLKDWASQKPAEESQAKPNPSKTSKGLLNLLVLGLWIAVTAAATSFYKDATFKDGFSELHQELTQSGQDEEYEIFIEKVNVCRDRSGMKRSCAALLKAEKDALQGVKLSDAKP